MFNPARWLAILLIAVTGSSVAAQNTKADSLHQARLEMRQKVLTLLDSAEIVRGTTNERGYMWRVATLLAEFPDSLRAAREIRSVDDAASSLERVLMTFGMAVAVAHSTPSGALVSFSRVWDPTATRFSITANDSQVVSPASYSVVCTWPGKEPSRAQRADCTSHCIVECHPPE